MIAYYKIGALTDGLQQFCKLLMALVMLGVCESFWRGLWFVLDYQRYHALKKVKTSLVIPRTELTRPSCFCPSMAEHLERQIVFMGQSSMANQNHLHPNHTRQKSCLA